jgi:Ca2+-binding RTX toxin-like protein
MGMQRIVLLLGSMAAAMVLAGGVAFAATVYCPTDPDRDVCNGTEEADVLVGRDPEMDHIFGDGGDDKADGYGGYDTIVGEAGNDTLYGGEGQDTMGGSTGADSVYGGDDVDDISGDEGNDFLHGGPGSDDISAGSGKDQIRGGGGGDYIDDTGYFDGVVDTVDCGSGTDRVYFEKGIDKINSNCENKIPYTR